MSAQESCLSLIKYFLFVFNLFFFVLGGLIFCFGTWILIDKTSFVSFVGLSFVPLQTWSKVLAVSGVLTMALALLGCVGALKELRCLLGLYFGMLLLLFATQITLGILISTQRVRLERRVQELVLRTIQSYRTNPDETAAEESWDYAQFQLRCCGWQSPRDWNKAQMLKANESEEPFVPCSCYNSTATNDSTVFDKLFFSQLSRLGPRAKLRQTADICALPAKAHIYREVGLAVASSSGRVGLGLDGAQEQTDVWWEGLLRGGILREWAGFGGCGYNQSRGFRTKGREKNKNKTRIWEMSVATQASGVQSRKMGGGGESSGDN